MNRGRLSALVSIALLGGAIAIVGCAQAATKANTATTASATTATDLAVHGSANIMLYSINSDGPDFRAIVTGAIGDYGPAVTVYPDGKVDPTHSSEMELKLTRGSFRLDIATLDKKFVQLTSHEPIYPGTCSDVFGFTTDVPVVAGSGIGAYRRISGGFAVTLTGDEVQAKPCTASLRISWQALVIAGRGYVADLPCVRAEEGERLAAPPPAAGGLPAGGGAACVRRRAVRRRNRGGQSG
jgi:hypothetical protein